MEKFLVSRFSVYEMMLPDVIGHENQSHHYQHHRCLCLDLSGRITTPYRFSYHTGDGEYTYVNVNVKLRKFLSAYKSHVRKTSLFTGAIPNPVRNSQTSRFVSVPGQNPERSSRGDCVVLRLE